MRQPMVDRVLKWLGAACVILLLFIGFGYQAHAHDITFIPPVNNVASYNIDMLKVSETGQPRPITWCNPAGQQTADWQVTIAIHEFPTPADSVPVAQGSFPGTTTSWNWIPSRAGLYAIRARSCDTTTSPEDCSGWGDSAGQTEVPGCPTNAQDFVLYIKLAAPTGGTIE